MPNLHHKDESKGSVKARVNNKLKYGSALKFWLSLIQKPSKLCWTQMARAMIHLIKHLIAEEQTKIKQKGTGVKNRTVPSEFNPSLVINGTYLWLCLITWVVDADFVIQTPLSSFSVVPTELSLIASTRFIQYPVHCAYEYTRPK